MIISKVKLHNFRIYKGENIIEFNSLGEKNINILAGKNGFGKTTFLTSLIWCFYGNQMSSVEEKYKKDIKSAGGYAKFLELIMNRSVIFSNKSSKISENILYVEIELKDILIPSIPCRSLIIKRSYNIKTKKEKLDILIDGDENELTKEIGFEIFINDFILPREIAKFFFFDAEKIVSLAEAKTKEELKSLSKAYSEVLGIKKYEDLKRSLELLLLKIKRKGVTGFEKSKLDELLKKQLHYEKTLDHNKDNQQDIDQEITFLNVKIDSLQEKLIREGNSITVEELKELKINKVKAAKDLNEIKLEIKKFLELAPFVIAGKSLKSFNNQLNLEDKLSNNNNVSLKNEINDFSSKLITKVDSIFSDEIKNKFNEVIKISLSEYNFSKESESKTLLNFNKESYNGFKAIYENIRTTFLSQFNTTISNVKNQRIYLNRIVREIKKGEARKNNSLARQFRKESEEIKEEIQLKIDQKNILIESFGAMSSKLTSHNKVLSEFEKNFKLIQNDKKKFEITKNLLNKVNSIILKIKEEKKYSLQKSVLLGLNKLMHKNNFIKNVLIDIDQDIMNIRLIDKNKNEIEKDSLSKGEQQLYATALLKALVDESGINFPVFIDSPLQKFDKFHSKNIIKEFYPTISEQVVLLPLLEKELSVPEYELIKPFLNKVFLIQNKEEGSTFFNTPINNLFNVKEYV